VKEMASNELPKGWVTGALTSVCRRIVDGSHNPPKASDSGKPMLSARNIHSRKIHFGDYRLIPEPAFAIEDARTSVSPDDVLLTIVGTIGRTAVVPNDLHKFSLQRSVAVLKRTEAITSTYLAFALESPAIQKFLDENAKGTAQKGIYLKALGEVEIPIAPLAEQKRIADKLEAVLGRVDACRARLDRVPDLLKRFRQSVLAAATSGQLTEDWREGRTTEEWKELKVSDVGSVQLGRQRAPKYHRGENMRPYLRVQNVFEARLDLSDVMEMEFSAADFERYKLSYGDILLNEGQSPQYLGRPAMYRDDLPGVCFTNSLIRFRAKLDILDREYALLVFRHYMRSGRFAKEGSITTNIAHLSAGKFANIEFFLPPLPEQAEIVRRVEALFAMADRIEARLTAARAQVERLTPATLCKAFRGDLVPQDPNDEPASVLLERIRKERDFDAKLGRKVLPVRIKH
jgi:type I restriction enzyme S subunit